MIRLTITVPLESIPGVEIEAYYDAEYHHPQIEGLGASRFALVFEGEVIPDWDYEEEHDFIKTRPEAAHALKMSKPRLRILD